MVKQSTVYLKTYHILMHPNIHHSCCTGALNSIIDILWSVSLPKPGSVALHLKTKEINCKASNQKILWTNKLFPGAGVFYSDRELLGIKTRRLNGTGSRISLHFEVRNNPPTKNHIRVHLEDKFSEVVACWRTSPPGRFLPKTEAYHGVK